MMISLDTQLDTIDLELDDLRGLSADEMVAEILEVLPEDLSQEELEALKEKILDELDDELKNELKDLLNSEQSAYREAEVPKDRAECELNIEEIEDVLAILSPFEEALDLAVDEVSQALDYEKLLNIETADNLSWTSAGLEDGETVAMKCTGVATGSGSVWDDELQSGELKDVDDGSPADDGVVTYADYEAQVLAATGTDLESVQSITLGAAGEVYTLAAVGEGTITFRVTNAQGQSFLLTIEGSPVIYFSPGVVALEQIETWPETLTNRCYEMGDTMSFGNHLYANSLSDEDKLAYIETYEEVVGDTNFDAVWNVFYGSANVDEGYGAVTNKQVDTGEGDTISMIYDAIPKDELKLVYQESLKILYKYVNDPSSYSSMSDAWADVFQLWDFMGLNANDKRMVAEAMVLGVFQKGGEYFFQAFFQPVATILQNVIFAAGEAAGTNSNAFDKTIQILLFTHAGGDATFLSGKMATQNEDTSRYEAGNWGNHEENIEALELYQSLCANSGWALANAATTTAIANEKAIMAQDVEDAAAEEDPMTESIHISEGEMYALMAAGEVNNDIAFPGYSVEAEAAMNTIFTAMYYDDTATDPVDVAIRADELRNDIMNMVSTYNPQGEGDDVLSILLYTLSQKQPGKGILTTLLEDSTFKDFVEKQLFDQVTAPAFADLLIEGGYVENTYEVWDV